MLYQSETEGIRVGVRPSFSLARSDRADGIWAFSYDVRLENHSAEVVQLLFRHWHVHDAGGTDVEVDGEGIVGRQPVLIPGATHEYTSFCVLETPAGYMEGYYTFARASGEEFRVAVPRFRLQAPLPPPETGPSEELTN